LLEALRDKAWQELLTAFASTLVCVMTAVPAKTADEPPVSFVRSEKIS
jgi:hypothetical protein